ncbi:AAA family ATPase [Phyllobacterium myrsinacearum]|uniref:Putative kinase n=1 Tax=Phyllobacterium myrsinacearum TaxID=28101 RepID=A0A839EIQ4_9HYPH|nr:AAA family ATPase [Phyllobacterium myrsinacearum]MBA8877424.1 putative kinase [Phyllobacterium myrsinacearum]
MTKPHLYIVTGAMAAGKSTVAQALAERLPKSVHLRGDIFRRMIVNGAAVMGPELSADAITQLDLRQALACDAARHYVEAGFSVVYQDILIGHALQDVANRLAPFSPRIVVLNPRPDILAQRDEARSKTGYSESFPPVILADALERETPRIGLWIDTSAMAVTEVVDRILAGPHPAAW